MKESVLGYLGALLLRIINRTLRWERKGLEISKVHWGYLDRPIIVAFWHSDQLMAPFSYLGYPPPASDPKRPRRPAKVLISEHRDGRLIAKIVHFLSIGNIPGSSTRGGLRAIVKMKESILKERCHITITPDGPKGPPRQVKPGTISLSSATGAPILPIGFGYQRVWKAKSWDQMLLPKPFSRARMVAGELFHVPEGLSKDDLTDYSDKLTNVLNELKEKAEQPFEVFYREAQTS